LQFTFEWSDEKISYLDVTLVMEGGELETDRHVKLETDRHVKLETDRHVKLETDRHVKLETDRHVKPTNPQLFLQYSSNHPRSVFKAIVYGQAITVRTICSIDDFVSKHLAILDVDMVQSDLDRGSRLTRADLLKPKPVYPHRACPTVQSKQKFVPTFIITYNPHNPELIKWLHEVHFILLADQKLAKIYSHPPSVTFRQPKNLKQILC
jgi:hypothetical protein